MKKEWKKYRITIGNTHCPLNTSHLFSAVNFFSICCGRKVNFHMFTKWEQNDKESKTTCQKRWMRNEECKTHTHTHTHKTNEINEHKWIFIVNKIKPQARNVLRQFNTLLLQYINTNCQRCTAHKSIWSN